jgi:hypothetical protein
MGMAWVVSACTPAEWNSVSGVDACFHTSVHGAAIHLSRGRLHATPMAPTGGRGVGHHPA